MERTGSLAEVSKLRALLRWAVFNAFDWLRVLRESGRLKKLVANHTVRGDALIAAGALTLAGCAFLVTWLVSHLDGFGGLYLRARCVYVGAGGVAWSAFWYVWSVRHLPWWFDEAVHAFRLSPDDERWVEFRTTWRRRLQQAPGPPSFALIALVFLYLFVFDRFDGLPPLWGLPSFPADWSRGTHLTGKELVLALWSIPIVLALVPNVVGSLKYACLVWHLVRDRKLPLVRSVVTVREGMRQVAWFGVVTGAAWTSGAVAIVSALGPRSFDVGALIIVIVLGLLGVQLFVASQLLIHHALERLRRERLEPLLARMHDVSNRRRRNELEAAVRDVASDETWVHASGAVAASVGLVLQAVLPAVTFVLKILVVGGGGGAR
ncbi:MAG: hypothetical protein ABSB24_13000 [Gaiellaceae bacterium]